MIRVFLKVSCLLFIFNSCNQDNVYIYKGLTYHKLKKISNSYSNPTKYNYDLNEDGYLDKIYISSSDYIYSLKDSAYYKGNHPIDSAKTNILCFQRLTVIDGKRGKKLNIDLITALEKSYSNFSEILNGTFDEQYLASFNSITTKYKSIRIDFWTLGIDEFYFYLDFNNDKTTLRRVVLNSHWQNHEVTNCIADLGWEYSGTHVQLDMDDIRSATENKKECRTYIDTIEYNKIKPQ
jgi:hypothetical protein